MSSVLKDKVCLVTGAFGFSGSYVVDELLKAGARVVATDHHGMLGDGKRKELLDSTGVVTGHKRLTYVGSDLLNPADLKALNEYAPQLVFHTASLYDYSAELERLNRINVTGTKNLCENLDLGKLEHFFHWSTCGVFGKPIASGPNANLPFDEESSSPKNTPPEAKGPVGTTLVNAYSESKWTQEKYMWRLKEEGLPLTVIRPAPIYGPGSDYGHGGIICAIAKGYVPAIPLDAKSAVTTSCHVRDIARFAVFAAENFRGTAGEDFNVIDNSIISYYDFLHYIALLTGRRLTDIPLLPVSAVRPVAEAVAQAWTYLEKNWQVPRVRILEIQSASYIGSSYWLSNRKTLGLGFEYTYSDVREGLKDTVVWLRRRGLLH